MRWKVLNTIALLVVTATGLPAQRVINWPVRTTAMADAVVTGTAAVFWNPAAITTGANRGEGLVVNLRSPSETGLAGIAAAAAAQLNRRTTLAIAYTHYGVDDITLTNASPVEGTSNLSLGEDHFTLAASHAVGNHVRVGAVTRYARDNIDQTDAVFSLGAGLDVRLDLPLSPRLAGFATSEVEEVGWAGAAEISLPKWFGAAYALAASYGASDAGDGFLMHRLSGQAAYEDRAIVSVGMTREGDDFAASWQPTMAASLRLNRYTLGVLRESLSNDLGATYSFRLQVGIGR